jgi:UDP-glucuronate 4-epimerase
VSATPNWTAISSERWLITGALGCVGAWCCRQLVREGHTVVGLDLESDRRRAQLIMSGEELAAVEFVRGDITD